jgi:hypothetical protein
VTISIRDTKEAFRRMATTNGQKNNGTVASHTKTTSQDLSEVGAHFTLGQIQGGDGAAVVRQSPTQVQSSRPPEREGGHERACPCHVDVVARGARRDTAQDRQPIERFVEEGGSEQDSLLVRPENGRLLFAKECTCVRGN